MLVPLFRLVDELLAWNLGPFLVDHDKHWNGQKNESPIPWTLSEKQLQAFNNLAVYPGTRLFHECSLCSLGSLKLCLEREVWSCEYHRLTCRTLKQTQQFWHGLNLNCVYWLWRKKKVSKISLKLQFGIGVQPGKTTCALCDLFKHTKVQISCWQISTLLTVIWEHSEFTWIQIREVKVFSESCKTGS